jgi:hypothetical protein
MHGVLHGDHEHLHHQAEAQAEHDQKQAHPDGAGAGVHGAKPQHSGDHERGTHDR